MQGTLGKKRTILGFLLPATIIYFAFVVVSIIWAGYYSFFDWRGVGEMNFVGFKNYITLLTEDPVFWLTVKNTIVYMIINVIIQVFGGLLLAIFLTRITKFRSFLQTMYYVPVVISSVAFCQIFIKLFSVTPAGVVNSVLSIFSSSFLEMEWISNADISLYVAAFVEGYKYVGLYMVISYAALIAVPKELSEAAIIDGANLFQEYLYVRIPYIKGVIVANCILVVTGSLRSFDISFLLTQGGPGNASELMSTYMYKQAFSSLEYGYGSAIAIAIVIICLAIGFGFRRITEGKEE
ncbi:sugar ABC transporter permease [Lederbergia sp. NSJ-179]|uniref:carbohydrate ABC transporter permease n=1 Tax=Lederbergia sp. NSJ-179 TaxID=2931402 RepID=UPI001FD1A850|nr:sugar ABC transporter permease [Lederbergia sp. NSJ-179]MCJ7842128.1 sugar ABC transporter permease [Lederbergia sp. NSJ-179]